MEGSGQQLTSYPVWDKTVRTFHWLNVVCVVLLMALGIVLLNAKALGVTSDGKILLKTVHVYIAYVFTLNLLWRIIWGFIGSSHAKWSAILPFRTGYKTQLMTMIRAEQTGQPVAFLGHDPIARLMISFLFLLLSIQAITGLVLAGTDVYMPPLGNTFKQWVAIDNASISDIKPYSKQGIDEQAYQQMRSVRKPFITTHYYVFYLLLAAIIMHILAVVISEIRQGNGLISAMFTGNKVFSDKPIDVD